MQTLKRTAHDKLKVGTKKDEVIRFFSENGIPLTIEGDDASGAVMQICIISGSRLNLIGAI